MLLYSDGVIEAMNTREELFGQDRLAALLRVQKNRSSEQFAEAVLREVVAWSGRGAGRGPEDDISLLVVDVKG